MLKLGVDVEFVSSIITYVNQQWLARDILDYEILAEVNKPPSGCSISIFAPIWMPDPALVNGRHVRAQSSIYIRYLTKYGQ